jgi:hypothetical protein
MQNPIFIAVRENQPSANFPVTHIALQVDHETSRLDVLTKSRGPKGIYVTAIPTKINVRDGKVWTHAFDLLSPRSALVEARDRKNPSALRLAHDEMLSSLMLRGGTTWELIENVAQEKNLTILEGSPIKTGDAA